MTSSEPVPHALMVGGPNASVRGRMEVPSLLQGRVLLEAGQMIIQAAGV